MPGAVALVALLGSSAIARLPAPGDIVTLAPTQEGIDPSRDIPGRNTFARARPITTVDT